MKILSVNTYHYLRGGDCRYALGVADALRERGHEVVPFAMHHPQEIPSPWSGHFAAELDYPALQRERTPGATWKVLTGAIYNRQARLQLRGLLDHQDFDLAHLHSVMHHLTASVVLELYERQIPVVWTLHDLKPICPTTLFLREGRICEECGGGRFYNAVRHRCKRGNLGASLLVGLELYLHRMWRIYERASLLIAPSRFLRDKLLEHGLRPRRMEVLPNFVEMGDGAPAVHDEGYILYVGRLSREKGLHTLLQAVGSLPECRLRIAGTGEMEGELRETARQRSLVRVHFEGHCTGEQLGRLYRGAQMVVVPSEWYENCPLVVSEAYAAGKAVVASDLGGLTELVEHGVTGLLLPPGDAAAWSRALGDLLGQPERLRRMGAEGRRRAERLYAKEGHVDRLERLLGESCEGWPGRARREEGPSCA